MAKANLSADIYLTAAVSTSRRDGHVSTSLLKSPTSSATSLVEKGSLKRTAVSTHERGAGYSSELPSVLKNGEPATQSHPAAPTRHRFPVGVGLVRSTCFQKRQNSVGHRRGPGTTSGTVGVLGTVGVFSSGRGSFASPPSSPSIVTCGPRQSKGDCTMASTGSSRLRDKEPVNLDEAGSLTAGKASMSCGAMDHGSF